MARVLVFDTSVLCVWLRVAGKETCGTAADAWNWSRVKALIAAERKTRTTFVLPLASIVETGNHIAQAPDRKYETARGLMALLKLSLEDKEPWAAFSQQAELWGGTQLLALVDSWPKLAAAGLSLGDATIKDVAEFYARTGAEVVIATGDQGLKAYEPAKPPKIPRRRG